MIKLIGVTGPAGAGKDTVADYLVRNHGFTKMAFADPLKQMLTAAGLPEPANREDKEKPAPGFGFTWREAAQKLGDWGRALDPDFWVKIAQRRIVGMEHNSQDGRGRPLTGVVLSDVRFKNEAAMIHSAGGRVIHLGGRSADLGANAGHVSEAGLDLNHFVDPYIHNVGTLEQLYSMLGPIMKEI